MGSRTSPLHTPCHSAGGFDEDRVHADPRSCLQTEAAAARGLVVRIRPRRLAHRVTTAHLQAAYPFVSEGGLGGSGVYIGRDIFGGSFCFDIWSLYGKEITGPNMLVIGQIGY